MNQKWYFLVLFINFVLFCQTYPVLGAKVLNNLDDIPSIHFLSIDNASNSTKLPESLLLAVYENEGAWDRKNLSNEGSSEKNIAKCVSICNQENCTVLGRNTDGKRCLFAKCAEFGSVQTPKVDWCKNQQNSLVRVCSEVLSTKRDPNIVPISIDYGMGVFQFQPTTWLQTSPDYYGSIKGKDPWDISDAVYAAAIKLCLDGGGCGSSFDEQKAIKGYNSGNKYLSDILEKEKKWGKVLAAIDADLKKQQIISEALNELKSERGEESVGVKEISQSNNLPLLENNDQTEEANFRAFTSACDITVFGSLIYSLDIWGFFKSSSDEFVDGTFTNKNGCKVDVWLGIQGSFCGVGETKEADCSEKADTLTINGNKVDRLFAVKGKAFFADYYVHADDKSCCNSAGCGHDFDFQMSAPDEETGKKCMADFEEMLKNLRLSNTESAKAATPVENDPVVEKPAVSNQPPTDSEVSLTKSRGDITASIVTNKGTIKLQLYGGKTPVTVANFVKLAQSDFYDNLKFHRVIDGFMIQGGDPLSNDGSKQKIWGTGGPGYKFDDEPFSGDYARGVLAMANSGPNTNGSQFFIMQKDYYPLPHSYVIFGKVTEGMDVVDAIAKVKTDSRDCPIDPIVINDIKIN